MPGLTKSKRFKNVWSLRPLISGQGGRTNAKSLVAVQLVVGREHEELSRNSLNSFLAHNPQTQVTVYHSGLTREFLQSFESRAKLVNLDLEFPKREFPQAGEIFGTEKFNVISNLKWEIILNEIKASHSTVLFFDTDVAFRRPASDLLIALARQNPIGLQDEAEMKIPPTVCTGFMFWTPRAKGLLRLLVNFSRANPGVANDQTIFNDLIKNHPSLAKKIYVFPTSLFPNGLHARLFSTQILPKRVAELLPYIFHANWVVGSSAKIELLKSTGNWQAH